MCRPIFEFQQRVQRKLKGGVYSSGMVYTGSMYACVDQYLNSSRENLRVEYVYSLYKLFSSYNNNYAALKLVITIIITSSTFHTALILSSQTGVPGIN